MGIEIRRLTPEMAEDYVRFFDETPHNVNTGGGKCYCVTWRSDDSYTGSGDHWFPTPEERRARALGFVGSGSLQGYLAYDGGRAVGWCNANGSCKLCLQYLASFWPIAREPDGIRVKSVFCFVIAPDWQRRGIATRLLQRVCQDAAREGYDFVEAYVDTNTESEDFRGYLKMYEKCGFRLFAQREGRAVVRRALKQLPDRR